MAQDQVTRRLAAILFADLVGYSRLMSTDEAGTLARLKDLRNSLIDPKIDAYHGHIVKTTGDGALVEFASVVDAVLCAVDVQRAMREQNAATSEQPPMEFRIGINLGDVMIDGNDIYGDGVNVAARLEGLAEPGGICISRTVFNHIRNKVELSFEDLGERQVKNIAEPIRIYRVLVDSAAFDSPHAASMDAMLQRPAVAVLPFANMSGDPEQEYFVDGLTEDIITALAAWRNFPVIARNSTFAYKGTSADVRQAARELGARYVLEGSVRKAGMRVRVTAQLIDATSGHHLWAERLDRDLEDVFELQDELTRRIATTIVPELQRIERKRSVSKSTENLNAWDLYLRGTAALQDSTGEGNARARELFERAIELDPKYSEAHAALGQSHLRDILMECAGSREESLAKAFEAARRAVALNDTSSYAHVILAQAYLWRNEHELAVAETRRAAELNPYDAEIMHSLGNRFDLAGDPDGISLMEQAQQLNPQDPQRHMHLCFLARAYLNARQYEKAVEVARNSALRRPDYPHAHYILAIALGHLGRHEEARAALHECERLHSGFVKKRDNWQPYPDPASNDHLRDGLRKAGLPE